MKIDCIESKENLPLNKTNLTKNVFFVVKILNNFIFKKIYQKKVAFVSNISKYTKNLNWGAVEATSRLMSLFVSYETWHHDMGALPSTAVITSLVNSVDFFFSLQHLEEYSTVLGIKMVIISIKTEFFWICLIELCKFNENKVKYFVMVYKTQWISWII